MTVGSEAVTSSSRILVSVWRVVAVGDQALGDMQADTIAALDRPDPVGVLTSNGVEPICITSLGATTPIWENGVSGRAARDRRSTKPSNRSVW